MLLTRLRFLFFIAIFYVSPFFCVNPQPGIEKQPSSVFDRLDNDANKEECLRECTVPCSAGATGCICCCYCARECGAPACCAASLCGGTLCSCSAVLCLCVFSFRELSNKSWFDLN